MQLVVAVGYMVQVSSGSVLVVQVWFSCWVRFGADVAQIGLDVVHQDVGPVVVQFRLRRWSVLVQTCCGTWFICVCGIGVDG